MQNNSTDLTSEPTESKAITPSRTPQTSHHGNGNGSINLFSLLFLAFMVLVGAGIWVTQFTGGSHNNNVQNTPVAFASSKPTPKNGFVTATPEPQIKIYVTGEVNNPGIYIMQHDDRINDALEVAGGVTEMGDISQLDLAQRVRDEMHINIPKIASSILTATVTNPTPSSVTIISNSSNPTNVALPNKPATTHTAGSNSGKIGPESGVKINLNTADTSELQRLPGVGATLAQRLVDYRTQHGAFHSVDDLHHVQGFTKTVVEKLKDLVIF